MSISPGQIIPVGIGSARWMFVTKITETGVVGRLWSARRARWTKTTSEYSRDACHRKTPNCAKPRKPTELEAVVAGTRLTVTIDGNWFLLSGSPTGVHRLDRSATPKRRLQAHWEGYCEAAAKALAA